MAEVKSDGTIETHVSPLWPTTSTPPKGGCQKDGGTINSPNDGNGSANEPESKVMGGGRCVKGPMPDRSL
jgi:hypothetical protein